MGIVRQLAYRHVGRFKGILFVLAVGLTVSMLAYTRVIVEQIKGSTRRTLAHKIGTYSTLVTSDNPELIALALQQIQTVEFPIVVTDDAGNPKQWKNVGFDPSDTSSQTLAKIRNLVRDLDGQGNEPLPIVIDGSLVDWIHYGDSLVIWQLRWLPWVEIVAAALFIFIGYTGFRQIKRSEERMVWVGLAKETAHQLGTPLTSLMGWLALLKTEGGHGHALGEMERDLSRLERVTARFSQIGSEPVLEKQPLLPLINETADYFRARLPQTRHPITVCVDASCEPSARINRELFSWVMENLIRNSIDALGATGGEIRVGSEIRPDWVYVDVTDNGTGIAAKNRRNVFRPGFSTKTRGWGLGLSLSQRIVSEYHGGRLFIKETALGKGTTMRIALRNPGREA